MARDLKFIAWFDELSKEDIALAGGKGANLAEMARAKIPVPPGFIVTSNAYSHFLEQAKLGRETRQLLEPLDIEDSQELKKVSDKIKEIFSNASIPEEIASEIKQAYRKLGGGLVAVRSSATAEDLPEASFAGQQRTFLNVQGEGELLAAVQGCWASLFEPRAIFYRQQQGFDHFNVRLAVPIQQMVQSETSGVMFTVEPLTSDKTKILIEAVYGLGEAIVSGEVTPDSYTVDKKSLTIIDKQIAKQEWQIIKNPQPSEVEENNIKVPISDSRQYEQKLYDKDIIALAKLGKGLEDLYQFPQDIEWAKQDDRLFIVQTRPVTTLGVREMLAEIKAEPLLTGEAASLGIASGFVKIVHDATQLDKVKKGDALVAEMTSPDFVPAMKRATAIVTDKGGKTSHAAIVSRELGIPCVVGTEKATEILKDGQEITVDGSRGRIYQGKVAGEKIPLRSASMRRRFTTKTKVYVNLSQPELADRVAARDVDGVGLLRAEFIIAQIGEHPRFMLDQKRECKFIDQLAQGINSFTKAFYPRPVVYRTTDFKTNEYRNLKGGEKYEQVEENPMLGYRGCSRYVQELDILKLEIKAIKKVRERYSNLWVMIPFVRLPSEMAKVKQIFESEGLFSSQDFKFWMMAEVPSNVLLIDEFLATGINGISIGSNDLTQLILGIDRDNSKLAGIFDERNKAVMQAMERLVTACTNKGVTSSICGQAPSFYPEITEKLVRWGITSVSVSPDMIDKTREIIATVEAKLRIPA